MPLDRHQLGHAEHDPRLGLDPQQAPRLGARSPGETPRIHAIGDVQHALRPCSQGRSDGGDLARHGDHPVGVRQSPPHRTAHARLAADRDFKLILLVTPTTSPERAEKVVRACGGFVYVVSVVGITGERDRLPAQLRDQIARLRRMTDLPLCVGFGVSKPEHVRELKELADGVIVGSALVKRLEAAAAPDGRARALAEVRKLVADLSGALNG